MLFFAHQGKHHYYLLYTAWKNKNIILINLSFEGLENITYQPNQEIIYECFTNYGFTRSKNEQLI
jgi:hypothetical protein